MLRICSYLVIRLFFLIMIIGMVGLWSGFFVNIGLYRVIPDSFEMPLGSLSGIAVDSEGNIYCGSQFYSRVQVYDSEGKFLHGIFINTGGMFLIRINSNDQLEVAIERGDKLVKFDKDGELIFSSSEVPNFSAGFDKKSGYYFYDEQRDITYQKKPILLPSISLFGSHVIKKDSSGKESVIIKTPFLKWLFMGPHPAFFFGVFGTIGSFIANKKFRNLVLRCIDAMKKQAQPEHNNHKTKSGKFIGKIKSVIYPVTIIFNLMMIFGIVGFMGGLLVQMRFYKVIPDSFEMPLGQLKEIAVDSEGNIYCGSQFYSRIQVYDTEGKFLHGISLNTSGGMFWIRINSNDQLEVAGLRDEKLISFDKNGKLLSSRSGVPNYSDGFDKESGYYCYDEQRDITYQIEPILLPLPEFISIFGLHVIKKDSSGKETVIIKTPFLKWLFMGPYPALFFVVFGTYSTFIGNKKLRNLVLRYKDTMYKQAQPEHNRHKTKSGKIIKKRSIIVALVSLGITGIAMMSMYILLYMNDIIAQQVMTISLLIITFVFFGIIRGHGYFWLMGRILGLISAIVLTIIALICLVFFHDRPYILPTVILIAFQVIFLFVMYYSLDTIEAREYCDVLCSKCGKGKIKTIDLVFDKHICRKCDKELS